MVLNVFFWRFREGRWVVLRFGIVDLILVFVVIIV